MNDFNKGELQIILLEMNISIQRTPKQLKVSPIYIALRDKVESMVDNYCQHEYICIHNESGHGHSWYKICRKCSMDLTKQAES